MKTLAILLLVALPIVSVPADVVSDAERPLMEGAPEVAVTRLSALLDKSHSPDEWRIVAAKLAEALIAAGQAKEALQMLDDERLRSDTAANFARAQALASEQRWNDALPLYESVAGEPASPRQSEATFGAAEMFRAIGQFDNAVQRLNRLTEDKNWKTRAQLRLVEIYLETKDTAAARRVWEQIRPITVTERKTRRLLFGRLEAASGHPEKAAVIFEALSKRLEGATHAVAIANLFQIADVHLQLKTPETGDDFIEDFIEHHPDDIDLATIFAKLDELYRAEPKPARSDLERWTRENQQPRRALAQWYLARIEVRGGHRDRALRLLHDLQANHPKTDKIAPALLELAQLESEDDKNDDALATLEEARALQPSRDLLDRIELVAAQAQYRSRRWEPAAANFELVAYSRSPFSATATFNAALSRLKSGDNIRFAANYDELAKQGGEVESRATLRLAEGLAQAARGDERAASSLRNFVRDFPNDPHVSEAFVALAELAFHRTPPTLDEARSYLQKALQSQTTPEAKERAEYLSIWLEDVSGGNDVKEIELANRFLNEHSDSRFATDVRMKLAESYYRRQDFANAQTHFEKLAQQNPTNPLTEKALFFAAESAMSSMGQGALERAITLFDRTVQLKADLQWAARNQQALIERRLGKTQDALLVYDEVLKNNAKPSEKREALCGKGDIYFDLSGNDPKNFDRAIEAYDALAKDAHDPGHWRNQALFKKGLCLEKKADRAGALAIFYEVLDTPMRADKAPEYFWFYKAGFNAARLLEEDSKWAEAAAIYEKLVAAAGPRSDEAKARLNRLRLEHFLWEN